MVAAPEILHVGLASAPSQARSLNPHPWQQQMAAWIVMLDDFIFLIFCGWYVHMVNLSLTAKKHHDYHMSSDSNVVISNKILEVQNLPSISGMLCWTHVDPPFSRFKQLHWSLDPRKPIISDHDLSWYLKIDKKGRWGHLFLLATLSFFRKWWHMLMPSSETLS